MRRHTPRPFGQSMPIVRLGSMLMALVVIWALYQRLRDPVTWRFLIEESTAAAQEVPAVQPHSDNERENIVVGPNDKDPDEVAAAEGFYEYIIDRAPLKSREMDAYWKLMEWSRTESFSELKNRASKDVLFRKLFGEPEKHRGELVHLRLHVRQVVEWDSPENPLKTPKVYEAWGWTDESRSFPYLVVFPDAPKTLPIGSDVRAEVEFVGYFLKVMTYTAFDHARGTPLLIGKIRMAESMPVAPPAKSNPLAIGLFLVIGVIGTILLVWFGNRRQRTSISQSVPSVDLGTTIDSAPTFNSEPSSKDSEAAASPFANLGKE